LPNSNADVRIINHEQAIALSKTPKLLGRQKEALLLGILWLFSDPALRVSIKGEEKRDLPSFWKNLFYVYGTTNPFIGLRTNSPQFLHRFVVDC
jgi:hypothetical protein